MKLAVRFALLALALSPALAFGDNSPHIIVATPGVSNGSIQRFTARFSTPMVALGDPRAASPFDVTCAVNGQGRWADQQTYVWEFEKPLPGGTKCEFKVKDGVKSVSGYALTDMNSYTVDAGGPIARAVLPSSGGSEIEEDQVFLVASNMPATPQSVAANAYCSVEGVGEKIPVDVLPAGTGAKLLADLTTDDYEVQSFLSNAGLPNTIPAAEAERNKAMESVTALKCHRPLPAGHDMALVWSGQIAGAGGKLAGADQRFDFTVRKQFTARFECSKVNPQAGCNPVEKAYVRFTAPIAMSDAKAIRITTADGTSIAPVFDKDEQKSATISDIGFNAPFPYSTVAKVTFPAGIKDESGRPLFNASRFPLDIKFDEAPPLVKFAAGFGILEAKEGGVLPVTVRNVEPALQGQNLTVGGQTLRVDASSDGKIADWLRRVNSADETNIEDITNKDGEVVGHIQKTGTVPLLTGADAGSAMKVGLPGKGKDFEVVGIPLSKPGFYVVELASPVLGQALLGRKAPRYVASAALVTNMAVHFKWGREQSLAWVTYLDSGQPVANAAVAVTDSCTGQLLANGKTDRSGAVFIPAGLPEPETYGGCGEGNENHPLMISARAADDFSFTLTDWGEGIRPYDFDLPYGYSKSDEIFHTVFDRALVRQGETIHMKHIVRQPDGTGFTLRPGFTGTLRLTHSGSDTTFDLPLTIDANGIGETEWTAPKGAPMGDYNIAVVDGDRTIDTSQSFKVDEYKLPTMRATVTGPKEAAIRPKTLPLDLFVGYLAGGGASNLAVEMRVAWFGRSATPDGYDSYTFGGLDVQEGTKPLSGSDEEDEAAPLPPTQTLPATLGGDGTTRTTIEVPQLDQPADMLVEMDYQDANGEVLTATKRIPIFNSAVQLGVKTDGWLMKQDDLRLNFVALDTDGKPKKGQAINVQLYSRQVLTARRRLIGGFYAYDNQMKTARLPGGCSTSTDELGLAKCTIDPGVSGEVYIVATTRDADGNVSRAVRSVWLAGNDEWWFGGDNGDRMDLVPEKQSYKAGETARFQVRMPFREAEALVTVEREGVLSSFVTRLSGENPVVEVKMPGSYAPDVFVSVMAVRGRVQSGVGSWLQSIGRSLGLTKAPPEAQEPTATIDLAKPTYRLGIAKVKVGWEGHQLGVTVKADKERYAARDTAMVDVAVKAPDGSPARSAEIAFAAVDQALLQLAPNDSWNLLDAMMGDRPLSVLTATAQTQVVGKRHYGKKSVEAGGGGGGDLSGLNRENFQPVLLWKGRVTLDANGHARLPVQLNDSLSTFKLVAIATDGPQLFGTGIADIRTAQDLTVYAGLPTLVRTGDQFAAGFTLRNGSDKPMTVTANVALQPAIAKGNPITVTIPAGGAAPIAWGLTAPAQGGQLKWTVSAKSADGKAVDQLTTVQDVIPAVPVEVWAGTLARVGDNTSIQIAPPAGAIAGRGVVDIQLNDSLAPPLAGVRAYMTAYPYNCFEQRLSRIVALGDAAGWATLSGEIPTYQANDGLLRYWPDAGMNGSEALTSYVLALTSDAGLPIPDTARTRMIEALKAVIDGRLRHEDYGDLRLQRLTAFNALARAGAATPAMLGQIGLAPRDMQTSTLADYIVALDKVPGLANGPALKADAQNVLRSRLVYEGTRLDLSDQGNAPWWLMSSGDESAIKAVIATLGRPGWNDDSAKMMVGVALRQSRGHWDTPTANAWGAVAARKFGTLYPASAITGTTTLALGSQTISKAWPLAVDLRKASFPLPAGPTPLRLAQAGGAGPWATVQVSAAVPITQPVLSGYKMTKKVEAVTQRVAGRWTKGDVIKVTITVEASAERSWVVINDPIPAGATIIGDMANQSSLLASKGDAGGTSYVERGRDAWKGYFAWMPQGTSTVSYTMRLNGSGTFSTPATRVEAMYSPSLYAKVPNAPMTIVQP